MESAILFGIFVVCVLMIVNFAVARKTASIYRRMMQQKDSRISLTQDLLMGIRQIKYLSWEPIFQKKILEIRKKELQYLKIAKILDAFCVFFWAATTIIISTFSFIAYDMLVQDVRKINVFTAIYLFNILIFPLNILPSTISGMLIGRISFRRLMDFFSTPEISRKIVESEEISENVIDIKNMSFIWPTLKNEKIKNMKDFNHNSFILKNVRLEIKKGSLIMILGKSGTGKTTLANAILKELETMHKLSNESKTNEEDEYKDFTLNGSIGYVSQNSWLQNTTIQDNILCGKKYEEEWYNFCVKSCELSPDLQAFKDGDHHEVGSEGFFLSGGQKQRISICRAMYQDADIYILDDIFSSVDAEVATKIFENAILALQKKGKTILLILSQYRFLKYASQVILLRNGELIQSNNEIKEYLQNSSISNEKTVKFTETIDFDSISEKKETATEIRSHDIKIESVNIANTENEISDKSKATTINIENSKFNEKTENKEEIREEGEIKMKTLMIYILEMGRSLVCFFLFTITVMQMSKNFFDVWLKEYVNYNTIFFIEDDFQITLILIAAFTIFWTFLRAFSFAIGNLRAARNIFDKLLHNILYSKISFFETNAIGRIINRFSGDIDSIDRTISSKSNTFLSNIFILIGSLVVIILQNYYIFISVAVILVFFYFIQKNYRHSSREIKRLDSVNYSSLLTQISETSNGVKIIRAHQKQNFFIETFKEKIRNSNSSSFLLSAITCWLSLRLQFLSTIIIWSILLISVILILLDKSPNANSFALSLSYSLSITSILRDLIMSLTATEREYISVERVGQYLHNELEVIQKQNKSNVQNKKSIINLGSETEVTPLYHHSMHSNVIVEFKNVGLKYDKTSDKFALKNVSFQIFKNQKVAFCGRSGCGKTSILNCIFRLYEIDQGEIYFMGNKIDNMPLNDLRSKISVVPQLGFLFKGTIKENLDPNNDFENEYIEKIISDAKLGTNKNSGKEDDLLLDGNFLNEKFIIEAGGKNLSNGEKQIINFLRIILRNNKIICLDEATSNLDPYTDEIFNDLIMKFSNRTLILITHRIHSLKFFDKIFVMNDGIIQEMGTYSELTENKDSFFNTFAQHKDQDL